MKKFIFISVSILIFCSIISCESMDATYKDFVKDGPIMYLTRLSKDGAYRTLLLAHAGGEYHLTRY